MTEEAHQLSIAHDRDGDFEVSPLSARFVTRDLGINAATQGCYHAYILKANSAEGAKLGPHRHTGIDFQMVYILKGWLRFWFDGHGEILAEAGTCVLQPPGIAHEALEWSDDMELLEVTSPRHFETTPLDETASE